MNPIISLKNFRSFGEDGADFELAPITILTGCNSAGKSSLVKALMLLSEKSTDGLGNIHFSSKLNISSKELSLGGYKSVTHEDGVISMSYRIWSADLQEELIVKREFRANRFDALNNGALSNLTVQKKDGTIVFQMELSSFDNTISTFNHYYNSVKYEFNRFFAVGCYMYFKETLLPMLERKKETQKYKYSNKVNRSDAVLNIVKKRLESVNITEMEAAMLWGQFNQDTWKAVIGATELINNEFISISDIEKFPEENDLELMINTFLEHVVNDVCSPFFSHNIEYINSASAQIARLYSVEDNNKMCNALRMFNDRKILCHKLASVRSIAYFKPGGFLNKWVKMFGIGDGIEVNGTEEGLGLMVYLYKEKERGLPEPIVIGLDAAVYPNTIMERRLLADEGYGITQLVALLLQIDNCIPISIHLAPDDEYYYNKHKKFKPKTICVEEPEIHLHPKYQSMLAEMFVEAYQKYNIHFIIETHSEYLIRKLQVLVADKENALTANEVSLNYVEKDENGVSHNRQIKIEEDGNLSDSFGTGFYDEADTLAIQLFRNKPILS